MRSARLIRSAALQLKGPSAQIAVRSAHVRCLANSHPFRAASVRCFSTPTVDLAQIKKLRETTGAPITDCKEALVNALKDLKDGENLNEKAMEYLRKKGLNTANKKAGRSAAQGLVATYAKDNGNGSVAAVAVEINSETDFVSRNDLFQNVLSQITTKAADLVDPQPTSSSLLPNNLSMDVVKGTKMGNETIADAVLGLVTAIRENIQLRRVASLRVERGVIGSYVHNAIETKESTPMGRIGSLVGLEVTSFTPEKAEALQKLANQIAMHTVAANPKYLVREHVPAEVVQKEKDIVLEQVKGQNKPEKALQALVNGKLNKFYEEQVLLEQPFMISSGEDGKPRTIKTVLEDLSKSLNDTVSLAGFVRYQVGEGIEVEAKMSFAEEVASKMNKA